MSLNRVWNSATSKARTLSRLIRYARLVKSQRGLSYVFSKSIKLFVQLSLRNLTHLVLRKDSNIIVKNANVISGRQWPSLEGFDGAEVVLVSNAILVASHEYRALNVARALELCGYRVCVMEEYDFINCEDLPDSIRLVYFFRTTSTPEKIRSWHKVKNRVKFAYDVDDLIFDENCYNVNNAPGLLEIDAKSRTFLTTTNIKIQKEIISLASFLSGPTKGIVDAYAKLSNAPRVQLPNVLPPWMIDQALKVSRDSLNIDRVNIGYASGTTTHKQDFRVAIDALFEVLKRRPGVYLTILGCSPIDPNKEVPKDLCDRIVLKPLVEHDKLLQEIVHFDINIAPLERNSFTEAKSELKFLHAALLGIPTVATPTEPFRSKIVNEFNGFLADTQEDWIQVLLMLVDDQVLRKSIGLNALNSIRRKCTIESLAEELSKELRMENIVHV